MKIYGLPFATVWHRKQKYVLCLLAFSFPFSLFRSLKAPKLTLRWSIYTSSFPSFTSALCWSYLCLLLECKWQFSLYKMKKVEKHDFVIFNSIFTPKTMMKSVWSVTARKKSRCAFFVTWQSWSFKTVTFVWNSSSSSLVKLSIYMELTASFHEATLQTNIKLVPCFFLQAEKCFLSLKCHKKRKFSDIKIINLLTFPYRYILAPHIFRISCEMEWKRIGIYAWFWSAM